MDIDWAKQKGVTLNFQQRRYAKNKEGEYLHFSGTMTASHPAYAWHGSYEQFTNLQAAVPFSRLFHIVEKE